jgi:hypothetical protein
MVSKSEPMWNVGEQGWKVGVSPGKGGAILREPVGTQPGLSLTSGFPGQTRRGGRGGTEAMKNQTNFRRDSARINALIPMCIITIIGFAPLTCSSQRAPLPPPRPIAPPIYHPAPVYTPPIHTPPTPVYTSPRVTASPYPLQTYPPSFPAQNRPAYSPLVPVYTPPTYSPAVPLYSPPEYEPLSVYTPHVYTPPPHITPVPHISLPAVHAPTLPVYTPRTYSSTMPVSTPHVYTPAPHISSPPIHAPALHATEPYANYRTIQKTLAPAHAITPVVSSVRQQRSPSLNTASTTHSAVATSNTAQVSMDSTAGPRGQVSTSTHGSGTKPTSQSGGSSCAPVAARNPVEAIEMESSTQHNGCWARDGGGRLVFLSNQAPDQSYKPILPSAGGDNAPPPIKPTSNLNVGASNPAGTWSIQEGVWDKIDLPLIRKFGKRGDIRSINGYPAVDIDQFKLSLTQRSPGRYCGTFQGESVCLVSNGTSTYAMETNGRRANNCVYIVEGGDLRGQCIDSPTRQLLVAGQKLTP